MDAAGFQETFERIVDNVNQVIHGKDDVVRLSLVAVCAGGHVLFEDVPGVGKSMLALALSRSFQAEQARVQCTPDMLPGDITGSSIIDTQTMTFQFRPGPVFTNVLLVDEINRATPKTQSALLEAMAERNVSVDGVTHKLPRPFLVLATQNPVELAGTFPLPEAQLDRFLFKLTMGYPDLEAERLVIRGNALGLEVDETVAVASTQEIEDMTAFASRVRVSVAVETYLLQLTHGTRADAACTLGAGPRASIALLKASKVVAAADGRDVVYAEDIKAVLRPVLAHRIMLTPDATLRGETVDDVLDRVSNRVKPPLGVDNDFAPARELVGTAAANGATPAPARRARRARG
jgi:MoxR-like ATPase